jgi:hypothetical protein
MLRFFNKLALVGGIFLYAVTVFGQDSLNVRRVWQESLWQEAQAVAVQDSFAFLAAGDGMQVLNISDPMHPHRVGWWNWLAPRSGISVHGRYAFVHSNTNGTAILDISNPVAPVVRSISSIIPYAAKRMAFSDTLAFAAGPETSFTVFRSRYPWYDNQVGQCAGVYGNKVVLHDQYAFVFGEGRFREALTVVNVSDPRHPVRVSHTGTRGLTRDLAVSGNYAYAVIEPYGFRIFDFGNVDTLIALGSLADFGAATGIDVRGNYAFITDSLAGLRIVDVSNPQSPVEVAGYNPGGRMNGMEISGNYAVVTDLMSGVRLIDITNPLAPVAAGLGRQSGLAMDVAVNNHYAYLAASRGGLRIYDVSDPTVTMLVAAADTLNDVRHVVVHQNHAYVQDTGGLQVLSVADPANPVAVSRIDSIRFAYSMTVHGDYLYVAAGGYGLHIVSVANPSAPQVVGTCPSAGSTRAAAVSDSFAYLADGYGGLRVFEISNPALPQLLFTYPSQNREITGVALIGHYVCMTVWDNSMENPGLVILDASIPDDPVPISSAPAIIADRVVVSGNYAYIIEGEAGIEIFNLTDPLHPVRTGRYARDGWLVGAAVSDGMAFTANEGNFDILDCSRAVDLFTDHSGTSTPATFELTSFPNPFNASTRITFSLPQATPVDLRVYDIQGRLVETLVSKVMAAGYYSVYFDGHEFASGAYLLRLTSGRNYQTQKVVLIK